ncbi:MAG: GTP pyrophosphokinase family protein [Lachnospiraceae bacterium]
MEKQDIMVVKSEIVMDPRTMKVKEYLPDDLSVQDVIDFIRSNAESWKEMQTYYYCAMMEIETKFKVLNQEFSLQYDRNPIETIKTRLKSPESLAGKLARKKLRLNIQTVEDCIFDMAGVRVICSFLEDVYTIADSFLKQDDIKLIEKKDYIQYPKPSGYRGLHLVVEVPIFLHREKRMMKVEVQLRTIAMDFWASLDHKLRYKKSLSPELVETLEDELEKCAEVTAMLDVRMQNIRSRIEENK